jgi:hypothetical protein
MRRTPAFRWYRTHRLCCFLLLVSIATARIAGGASLEGPLSADDALKAFQIEDGLQVELVAAEPVVGDPVALAFDERG